MAEEATDGELLDMVASQLYDSGEDPIPMDLHSACAVGNYKCVQDWINSGVPLEGKNKAGWTALMYASYVGHDTIVNLLLDAGVDPSCSTPYNLSPLMVAAGCGNESVCYFLIQAGADIDSQDSHGYTALVHAVRQGHQTVVQLLLEAGVDMEIPDEENERTPLMFAALEGDEIIVDVLLACGADLWAKDERGLTARYLAYSKHHVRTVTLLDNAQFMNRPMSETPTNIIPEEYSEEEEEEREFEEMSDLFSGAKEMEAYQESQAVKKSIQYNLGRRAGPRWSLPHQYIADRRSLSKSDNALLGLKRKSLRSAVSMPEQAMPPPEAIASPEPSPACPQMEKFLEGLGLGKYISILAENEIDYQTLTNFTDEDLKRVGITLMGPRRKLTLAISELKGNGKDSDGSGKQGGAQQNRGEEAGSSSSPRRSKPKLQRQSSTDVAEAFREAVKNIEKLEEQLRKEHQLRKTADIFLLELQTSRQEAVARVSAMRDMQRDISKHCKAVKSSHHKLSDELDVLRTLSSASIEPHQLQQLYSDLVTLKSRLGLELEALSRSIASEAENVNNLSLLLKSNS